MPILLLTELAKRAKEQEFAQLSSAEMRRIEELYAESGIPAEDLLEDASRKSGHDVVGTSNV